MQRKQYIKPIAKPKPLFFENLLAGQSLKGQGSGQGTTDGGGGTGDNGDFVGDDARARYDIDWFGTDKNSSFDF